MRGVALALVISVVVCVPATAQEDRVPAKLSLAEALRIAEARSAVLAGAQALVSMAEADVRGALKRPNPEFSLDVEGYPLSAPARPAFLDDQQLTLRVEQEFELAGRRGLREEVAERGLDVARAGASDRLRVLRFEVRRAYMTVVLARADYDVAETTLAEIDRVLEINRARFEQGELSGIELRRLQVERLRFADDLLSAELAVRNARSALLAILMVAPLDQAFETVDDLAVPSDAMPSAPAPVDQAVARRPDVEALRRAEEGALAGVRLARALGTPNITIGGGYQRDFGTNALVVDLRVPLPLFDRNEAGVARADATHRLAVTEVAAATQAASLEIQVATNSVDISRRRVSYIEREYLTSAREARDIVLASYRAGASTLIDYLDAQRALREAQRVQNRALFDLRMSLFQLEAAMGLPAAAGGASN